MAKRRGTSSIGFGLYGEFSGAVQRQLYHAVRGADPDLLKGYIDEQHRLAKVLRAGLLPQRLHGKSLQASFLAELVEQLRAQGGTGEELPMTTDGSTITDIARVIIGASLPGGVAYPVLIDYDDLRERGKTDEGILRLLVEAGQYNWWDKDILKAGFTVEGQGKVPVALGLYCAERDISSDGLISEIDSKGFRPASAVETLTFGAKYPNIQRQFPVVGLGSVGRLDGGPRVLYLDRGGAGRYCDLFRFGGVWRGCCRFLVARKPKA